ncbi:ATP-binding protein [Raineya orbicola]|jgi:predicted HTH transcriptional regulator|uniref:Divergent AAA domain n=1 Tax=Raineya orbicola TaxID=2016530 RepID=A0A2N3IJV5_9BACT|nr:RNA-binding domain-containing protein [Raineya orbicola]PKQ70538.1 Divergent AAA domain [Raineya orbicola]
MREIDRILLQIENCLENNQFQSFETDKLELKDLSQGDDWKELYKTTCAFLNTKGGIIVIGIKEIASEKKLKFTGFNSNNESKLKELPKVFTNENNEKLNLIDYIRPDLIEIKPFLNGQIVLLFIEKLPDEQKFVFWEGNAYERQGTGDHKIPKEKILKQNELKTILKNAIELDIVPNTSLQDLDIDKLNEYILKLNSTIKVETLKADIESAIPFLTRKKFIRDQKPTLLGMLVCGKHIEDFLAGKCEIDAYYETGNHLADDKKIYKNNIINLMENAWNFVFSKISVGITTEQGGKPIYEYPEDVIRETINNALAHRDYKSDNFCIIRVKNKEFLEIKNPGTFKSNQLVTLEKPIKLRRIIPFPNRQNPNLADVLKDYNRYEGRGIGMATLCNYALENQIDVPYYLIHPDRQLSLFLVPGKVLDSKTIHWLNSFHKYILQKTNGLELSSIHKTVLAYFFKSEKLNDRERYTINLSPDNNHFEVISDLLKWGLLWEIPESSLEIKLYRLDETLKKENFINELRAIFGKAYDDLSNDAKWVLDAIYHQNHYGRANNISASFIGEYLFYKQHSSYQPDIKAYENFKRKIRNIINKLEKQHFIRRKETNKPDYTINLERASLLF